MPDDPIKKFFYVHSCTRQPVEQDGFTAAGRPIKGMVDGVVVELLPEDGNHGTITLRYLPDDDETVDQLMAKYVKDCRIEVTTTVAAEQPKPKTPLPPSTMRITAPDAQRSEPAVEVHAPDHPQLDVVTGGTTRAT